MVSPVPGWVSYEVSETKERKRGRKRERGRGGEATKKNKSISNYAIVFEVGVCSRGAHKV
jgi:hypothetical protein